MYNSVCVYYIKHILHMNAHVCVCRCVCVCMHVCVHVYVRARGCVRVCEEPLLDVVINVTWRAGSINR